MCRRRPHGSYEIRNKKLLKSKFEKLSYILVLLRITNNHHTKNINSRSNRDSRFHINNISRYAGCYEKIASGFDKCKQSPLPVLPHSINLFAQRFPCNTFDRRSCWGRQHKCVTRKVIHRKLCIKLVYSRPRCNMCCGRDGNGNLHTIFSFLISC